MASHIQRLTDLVSATLRHRLVYVWAIRALQLVLFLLAGVSAFLLRFDFFLPKEMIVCLGVGCLTWAVVKAAIFHCFGLSRGMWRYFSIPDLVRVAGANLAASVLSGAILLLIGPQGFPRSILLIDFVLCVMGTVGVRALTRISLEVASRGTTEKHSRTLIYGAGAAGVLLLREVRENSGLPHEIAGFIDDNPNKIGMNVQGVRVLGSGAELREVAARHNVAQVIIAIPSARGAQMTRIVENCQAAALHFRTMPAMSEIIAGRSLSTQVRDVAVEDLLGRGTVHLNDEAIRSKIQDKVVLVTGAAGSIGSELCRQIARFKPAALIAFEISETALFHLENEIRQAYPEFLFYPEIGNIQNTQRVRDVFRLYSPALVLHAAAYKHVPMMERHVFEAVENNVFGTFNLAVVASECGVEDFVMISSDKAVNPTNIMGTTKRIAELVIRSLQNGGPRYVSVRFGNVLGSNGSVVPIFKKQIAAGGPVTVTHAEMRRYFMTIPEAAQLVLEACTMGKGGEIFVLDMGEPVKIVDLARQLIVLSGFQPNKDIEIKFTGMRPGEKLYEELNLSSEDVLPTHHQKINIFSGATLDVEEMSMRLARLRSACDRRDVQSLLLEMKDAVPEYNASKQILEYAFSNDIQRLSASVGTLPAASAVMPECLAASAQP